MLTIIMSDFLFMKQNVNPVTLLSIKQGATIKNTLCKAK